MLYPSVAYIDTPSGSGTGFLVEGGYVVTNHHVVWPYEEARVVFPDGTELLAPVAGWDPMSDITVLGPVNTAAPPLELQDGEDLALGSELFLLGYPGENEPLPKPAIVSGLLSRYRQWSQSGITYFQTDAATAGGQSGGVLVNVEGEIIGISGLSFTESNYALAASAADLAPIVRQLIQGQDPWVVSNRRFREEKGGFEFSRNLRNHWDSAVFLLDADPGVLLEVEIDSSDPAGFHVADRQGTILLDVDNGIGGTEDASTEISEGGIHFLVADTALHDATTLDISSSAYLHPFTDRDDGRRLHMNVTIAGNIDYPGDRDWYSIHLREGETVRFSADSWNVDTYLSIDFPGSRVNQVAYDDDSGGGLFETNSQLVYLVPKTGEYIIAVQDFQGDRLGGYLLSSDRVQAGMEAVTVPPSPQEVDSPFGRMLVYESSLGDFSVQVPADWTEVWPDDRQDSNFAFQAVSPNRDGWVLIQKFDLLASNEAQTLEELVAAVQAELSEAGLAIQLEKETVTSWGDPVVEFGVKTETEKVPVVSQVLLSIQDERFVFGMYHFFEGGESSRELSEYLFGTLRFTRQEETTEPRRMSPTPTDSAATSAVSADCTGHREALIALYHSADGDNWARRANWLSNDPVNRWSGVAADSDGCVTGLSLYENRLSGTIPEELGNLSRLKELSLSSNQLSGEIPAELGNLSNLEELHLYQNELGGTIPEEFGNLSRLRELSLSRNQLSGEIPAELGSLSILEELYLYENQLSGAIPVELGNLSRLKELSLSSNQLSGEIPSELGNLSNLEELHLYQNELGGTIPEELGNLSRLRELSLSRNQLSGAIPAELGNLSNLEELYLYENQLSGAIPVELGNLLKLKKLSLSTNQLSGEVPAELGNLSDLEGLQLFRNELSGTIPVELGNLLKLKRLSLSTNQLSGEIPAELGNLSNLEELYLYENQLSGEIPARLGDLFKLKTLFLDDNRLSGAIPPQIGSLLNLEELGLGENHLSGGIPSELGNLVNLKLLYLENNRLSGAVPPELGNLSHLEKLLLHGNQLTGGLS